MSVCSFTSSGVVGSSLTAGRGGTAVVAVRVFDSDTRCHCLFSRRRLAMD